jgi:chloride channel 3/4/5
LTGDLTMTQGLPESTDSSSPPSPTFLRADLARTHSNISVDGERAPLLQSAGRSRIRIQSAVEYGTGKPRLSRHHSVNGTGNPHLWLSQPDSQLLIGSLRSTRHHSRVGSWSQRLVDALSSDRHLRDPMRESKGSIYPDERVWYDQFTSTDWVRDSIVDAYRVKTLRSRTDIRGRIQAFFDGAQGWILSALVGFLTAVIAYTVDVSEAPVFDWKDGYCSRGFFINEKVCYISTCLIFLRKPARVKLHVRHSYA